MTATERATEIINGFAKPRQQRIVRHLLNHDPSMLGIVRQLNCSVDSTALSVTVNDDQIVLWVLTDPDEDDAGTPRMEILVALAGLTFKMTKQFIFIGTVAVRDMVYHVFINC